MSLRLLALRGARYHWRSQLGVLLGTAIACATLAGALFVGDSVRATLRGRALERIGRIDECVAGGDRFFTSALADAVAGETAAVVRVSGVAATPSGERRAIDVQVLGVDERFFALARRPHAGPRPKAGEALVNASLARQVGARVGDVVVVRVPRPGGLPRDVTLASVDEATTALRVTVIGTLADDALGAFALESAQVGPMSAFVDREWLAEALGVDARANLLLAPHSLDDLEEGWTLADAQLRVEMVESGDTQLVSERIFIEAPVASAAERVDGSWGVLAWFVNELRHGERSTPYSIVCAVGRIGAEGVASAEPGVSKIVPPDLGRDEIVINQWLADDLDAGPGDEIVLRYFVPAGVRGRGLEERTASFRVRSIVALEGPAADRTLMPAFPGLAESDHCRDWEPGIPIDLDRIRDVDETYWEHHRGTPKAFISLEAGRGLWESRFGALTAVRVGAGASVEGALESAVLEHLDPAAVGLFVRDVRGQALAAAAPATDFGGLFLGLSLFLIASAILLTALLFGLGVESRSEEIGVLLAVGLGAARVRRLFVLEASLAGTVGAILGVILAIPYTKAILIGLATIWRGAVGGGESALSLHASPSSAALAVAITIIAAIVSVRVVLGRQMRRPVAALLAGVRGEGLQPSPRKRGEDAERSEAVRGSEVIGEDPLTLPLPRARRTGERGWVLAALALLAAAVIALTAGDGPGAAGAFFVAGALALVAAIALCRFILRRAAASATRPERLGAVSLGFRNSVRRSGRSMAAIALLASASFLILAVGANRLDAQPGAHERASGTGGFALVGRSTLPVLEDLDTTAGRSAYGLDEDELRDVRVVSMRVRDGEEASCLELGRAQAPRLLGIAPEALAERGAFTFARTIEPVSGSPWALLAHALPDGAVPAIGDHASVTWAMGRAVGDTIEYRDERGRPFQVRLVGTVENSILQGSLVIDERKFIDLFPSEAGRRMFLIDAPAERAKAVAKDLSRQLADAGFEAVLARDRLAEFNSVQNTYLAIFEVLGALGLLLGSAGLGVIVFRNVLERRGELALLRAVGLSRHTVRRIIVGEHALLLGLGLGAGALAALVAVLPVEHARVHFLSVLALVAAVAASGFVWVWLAASLAMRGVVVEALRDE